MLAVAPEYQHKGIAFAMMQWYCQEMLKYKLGSFLFAPAKICDLFTRFHFNPGRQIQIVKGTLTCMYRAHTAPIPTGQPNPQDYSEIKLGKNNYRPHERTSNDEANSGHSSNHVRSSTQKSPHVSKDMLPPPRPLKKLSGKPSASLNDMGPPPKPTEKSSRQRATQYSVPVKMDKKRKERHKPSGSETSKVSSGPH